MASLPAYERDPDLRAMETEVVGLGPPEDPFVVLADTLFYPEGGGQPCDLGTISGVPLVAVRPGPEGVRHYLAGPLPPGPARLVLDWERRLDHMEQHTGQHLLTALAQDRFGWATTAFHLGAEHSDIELAAARLSAGDLERLEDAAAEEIAARRPVRVRRVAPADLAALAVRTRGLPAGHQGEIRLVEIEGLDLNTCGGTHLSDSGRIGALVLLGTETLRGGTRLFFAAGGRVRRRLGARERLCAELRALLGAPDGELASAAAARLAQAKDEGKRHQALLGELAQALAEAWAGGSDLLAVHFPSADGAFLGRLGQALGAAAPGRSALFTAGEGQGFFLVVAGAGVEPARLAEAGPRAAALLGGRGGGRGRLFQGKAERLEGRAEAIALLRALLA